MNHISSFDKFLPYKCNANKEENETDLTRI